MGTDEGTGRGGGTGVGTDPGCEGVLALLPPRMPLAIARLHPQTRIPLAPPLLQYLTITELTRHWD